MYSTEIRNPPTSTRLPFSIKLQSTYEAALTPSLGDFPPPLDFSSGSTLTQEINNDETKSELCSCREELTPKRFAEENVIKKWRQVKTNPCTYNLVIQNSYKFKWTQSAD